MKPPLRVSATWWFAKPLRPPREIKGATLSNPFEGIGYRIYYIYTHIYTYLLLSIFRVDLFSWSVFVWKKNRILTVRLYHNIHSHPLD